MKFTSIAAFTAALVLGGTSISYAAPLTSDSGDSGIQMRTEAQEAIFEVLARSLVSAGLREYPTRSFEDGGEVIWARDPTGGIKKIVHAQKAAKRIRNPGDAKRPLSHFMHFTHDSHPGPVRPENPEGGFGHIGKTLGRK